MPFPVLARREHVKSVKSFCLLAGLLRANHTLTTLTLRNLGNDHVRDLAPAEAVVSHLAASASAAPTPTAALTGIQSGEIALTWQPIASAGGE